MYAESVRSILLCLYTKKSPGVDERTLVILKKYADSL